VSYAAFVVVCLTVSSATLAQTALDQAG
jgi:hypothetical protein